MLIQARRVEAGDTLAQFGQVAEVFRPVKEGEISPENRFLMNLVVFRVSGTEVCYQLSDLVEITDRLPLLPSFSGQSHG